MGLAGKLFAIVIAVLCKTIPMAYIFVYYECLFRRQLLDFKWLIIERNVFSLQYFIKMLLISNLFGEFHQ
jgi:hypothetical protein